ncbi:MAG: excinuclease ABC subunit UvrC [Gammaproteobacteria bacterium]|nr:excinuclease ABC subunit UvrC [Gammaproteobacteria bacterium]
MSADDAPFDLDGFLATLTTRPGVYRMFDAADAVLYVGKARNLKRRVSSYFRRGAVHDAKTARLLEQVTRVEVTVTHTENEALILENQLIKSLRPRYNVLLRDDKSYPYIHLTEGEPFPRLAFHRGARDGRGRYFGPFPSAGAVRDTLNLLQKLFRVRQCEDSFFRNRTRPCLQYQIERCSAPCVGLVDEAEYARDVEHTRLFLSGGGQRIIDDLVQRMETASEALEFEEAARLRDRIAALRRVQARQYVSGSSRDIDVVACASAGGQTCIQVFFVRGGHNLGNRAFFPSVPETSDTAGALAAFLPQFYLGRAIPREILVDRMPEEGAWLAAALGEQAGHKVALHVPQRGAPRRWLALAEANARAALDARLASRTGLQRRLEALGEVLGLDTVPQRLECFDISHTQGERPVAGCVVFDAGGAVKSDYRRFNIREADAGDDYAALREAIARRYRRLKEGEGKWPDLLLIDGGRAQLDAVLAVLEELQVDGLPVAAVAKGLGRRPGLETLHVAGREGAVQLPPDAPALHLVQQVRDEAHRFAITGHRQRRGKARRVSPLESIPGLGPKRRRELLRQLGGLREIERAGVEDLARVPGISTALAERIYATFNEGQ